MASVPLQKRKKKIPWKNVSLALFLFVVGSGMLIGGVFTLPDEGSRGLAMIVIGAFFRSLFLPIFCCCFFLKGRLHSSLAPMQPTSRTTLGNRHRGLNSKNVRYPTLFFPLISLLPLQCLLLKIRGCNKNLYIKIIYYSSMPVFKVQLAPLAFEISFKNFVIWLCGISAS